MNAFTKLRILFDLLGQALTDWRENIWRVDLDARYCCNGGTGSHNICGCEGVTVRDVFAKRKIGV